ncbi:hypothetical protein BDV59DRAFT_130916 [Aspergillus ambiguus]|uniref:uncharacterized protein n=1 Tax=Aspergillus ambiguus TaxID=176160 RepID=UPI003CCD4A53
MQPSVVNEVVTEECGERNREKLLTELRDLLELPKVKPVAWLCLWFSEIGRLQDLVKTARKPSGRAALCIVLKSLDTGFLRDWLDQTVPQCRSVSVMSEKLEFGVDLSAIDDDTETEGDVEDGKNKGSGEKRKYDDAFNGKKDEGEGESEDEGEGEAEKGEDDQEYGDEEEYEDEENDEDYVYAFRNEERECLERDKRTCVVTKATGPMEVAYVIPSIGGAPSVTRDDFWDMLSLFWDEFKVRDWARAVNGQRDCSNMMCMSPHVRDVWKQARFALKPTWFSVGSSASFEFYWLNCPTPPPVVDLLQRPALNGDSVDGDINGVKLWDNVAEEKICSGKSFKLETSDPVHFPVPSWGLLEMQWFLQRIVAFSGLVDSMADNGSDRDDDTDTLEYEETDNEVSTEELDGLLEDLGEPIEDIEEDETWERMSRMSRKLRNELLRS